MAVLVKILDDLRKTFTSKRLLFLVCFLLLFFLFKSGIAKFIDSNLLCDKRFSNRPLDYILMFTSLFVSLKFIYKFFCLKYIPGYVELIGCFLVVFFCWNFLPIADSQEWKFTMLIFNEWSFPYVYLLMIPLFVFLMSAVVTYFRQFFSTKQELKTKYAEDIIIRAIGEDKLQYDSIVNRIENFIKYENFQKSFTIGLVGPWGNGKSSIVNLVASKINPEVSYYKFWKRKNDLIVIHFLPYLNHKEDDIISEFFTSLSRELSRFSGKLSNQILDYSNRVTNLYNNKNILELVKESSIHDNIPSKQLYDDINDQLCRIGKKIVVFIDDLDRLNEVEILQVLKLIRNTANFNNTIFVVAMDKDYVLSRLKANNHILDSRFIDKFFQLEVYLPELESDSIRLSFVDELMNSPLADLIGFGQKLNEALNNKRNLFDLHIKNFRDAKRVINQIIFEYPLFQDELDLKDFMNFVYLKLKFPKAIKLLNDNRNELLEITGGGRFYSLKKVNEKTNEEQKQYKLFEEIININSIKTDKYQIHKEGKSDSVVKEYDVDYELFVKTLACLFGEENEIIDNKSIKFENNFRKLMQQKYLETDLLESEFKDLFKNSYTLSTESIKLPKDEINNLFDAEKVSQLLRRFEYYNSDDLQSIQWSILIVAILYDKRVQYNINNSEVLKLLNLLVERYLSLNDKQDKQEDIGKWLVENLFKNTLSIENQLLLYGEMWRNTNNSWKINSNFLKEEIPNLFKKYLEEKRNEQLSATDYSMYGVYHSIKIIDNVLDNVKKLFINFWNLSNIEILCAQVTDFGSFTNTAFKLSDTTIELFGSKDLFIDFVESKNNNSEGLKEFLKLFNIFKIIGYTSEALFDFQKSDFMKEKIKQRKDSLRAVHQDEYENKRHIIFESNDSELFDEIISNKLIDKYNFRRIILEDKNFLIVNFDRSMSKKSIASEFVGDLFRFTTQSKWNLESTSFIDVFGEGIYDKSSDKYLKVVSIQPPLK